MDSTNPIDFQCYQVIGWLKDAQIYFVEHQDYPTEKLCLFLQEFCKIFKQLSKLLGIAFSDVNEKVEIMRARDTEYRSTMGGQIGIFSIIQREIDTSVINFNGDNNKKLKADKAMLQYVSLGRSLLRMMRFMDYLEIMFREVNNDGNIKLSDACSKAYREALYPYHTFMVQTAAKLAMHAAPDRQRLLKLFLPNQTNEEQAYSAIQQFLLVLVPVKEQLWTFYQSKNIKDLP